MITAITEDIFSAIVANVATIEKSCLSTTAQQVLGLWRQTLDVLTGFCYSKRNHIPLDEFIVFNQPIPSSAVCVSKTPRHVMRPRGEK